MTNLPRHIINERREKVKELYFVRGYTIHEVAKALDWQYTTIWEDTKRIREQLASEIKEEDLKKQISKLLLRNDKVRNKAWLAYNESPTTYEQLSALRLIQETDQHYMNILEKFGYLLPPMQRNVNVNIDWKELIDNCVVIEDEDKSKEISK